MFMRVSCCVVQFLTSDEPGRLLATLRELRR